MLLFTGGTLTVQKKYENYEQLFSSTISDLTENSEKWLSFLETASRMYKYSFEDQLLIYAQRPETRACADYSFWTAVNRMNRQLRQGCTEIALLDQEKRKLHYVYAMEDTEPKTNGKSRNPEHYIWQLAPDNRDVINDMLCRQGGINSNNIEKTIISMTSSMTKLKMAEYISEFDNIYHGLGIKSPKLELETVVAEIAAASAAYMTAKRTGTDVSNYLNMDCFSNLNLIDNPELTAFLGRVTTDTAGAVLKLIERNVNEHKIQERSSENEQLTKGENRERNTLRSERGNNDISPNISREQRGRNSDNTPLRQDEREVSQGELQSDIQQNADVRRVNSSSGIDRRTSSDNGRTDNIGNGESGRNRRGAESERPDEVDRSDEQLQTGSSRDNSQGTDRSILSKETEETKPSVSSVNDEAIHNAFNEFKLNHSFSNEQQLFFDRIEQFAAKNNVTENIIDRAFSERPVYRRTYGNRENLSKKMFEHSLKVLESELERAIRKNLAENNEKSAVSVEQETSETINVHSEKTEGQEMAKYSIYQLKSGAEYHDYRFSNSDYMKRMGYTPNFADYDMVYTGDLSDIQGNNKLEAIYEKFNIAHPEDFTGHSLSVSDIVVIEENGEKTAHFVDSIGFTKMPDFFLERKNNIVVDIPKYNLTLDFSKINSVSLKEEQQNYIGGLDSNGHEAKDNYDIGTRTNRYYAHDTELYVHNSEYGTMPTKIDTMIEDIEQFLDKSLELTDYRLEIEDKNGNTTIFDASKNSAAVNDDVSEEIIISSEDEIFEHNAAVLNDTQVDDVLKLQENGEEMYFRVTTITDDFMISMERVNEDGSPHTEIGIGTKAIVGKWKEILAKENENSYIIRNPHISNENEVEQSEEQAVTIHSVDDIEIGDMYNYKGREYTVVSMRGIYPDDVGISYNETMSNGTVYAVTENVDRHKLAREGIYLGKSDKLTQESTATEYSEVTRSMYHTDNPDVLIIEGKGSLAKIDITPTEELWNRLAEKGIVRTNESVDRIIFNTDNLNWNKLVIPDKWGNMTNNIDIDKVFTENEVRIAQSVADDVITPTLEGSQLSMFDEHITDDIILPTEEAPEEVLQVNEFENKQSKIIQDNATKTDFTITDDKLGEGGAKTKYRANVEAIKTLKAIEADGRTATPEEQEILSKYVGWGGLKNAFEDFHDDWKKEFTELKELLTPEEYKLAKASVLNAHYTSPLVIEKMYEALRNNGFTGGKILEPAMGIGNYFGKMPEDIRSSSNLYGVELDDISGRIAKQLYQNANIRITGFEKTLFKDNSFDLAIGNVPFGAYSLNEPKYNKYHFQIHDHFFAKALDKVKPGGIVAFITSKGTLDKKNPDVRKYLAERAELVGAIRLPNNAFKNNAGTEVTSDIIFLQKRENPIELTPLTTPDWVHLGKTDNGLTVNQYFIDNPHMVLGNIVAGNKLYGHGNDDTMCEAIEGADLSEQLSEAIKHINFEVLEKREEMAVEDTIAEIPSGIKNFSYAVINDKIYYRNNDEMELFNGKKSDIPRIKGMLDIRDTLRELIACQLDNGSDEQLHELQTKLNTVYDSFVAKYGRLNDKINVKAIKEDSSAPLLSSLEIYKGEEFSEKAAIFEKRTILAKNDVTSADTSSEALTLSLAKKACVDMAYMQELTGFSEEKILSELKGVVFENPIKMDENGKPRLEASDEYLSGNIRTKLEYMKTFHAEDSRYAHNIAALEAAMPTRIEAADIDVKLGSPCVKPEIIQQFMYDTFKTPKYKQDFGLGYKDSVTVQYAEINSTWFIPNKNSEKNNTAANSKFGTQRCSAYELLEDCLNMKNTVVKDAIERDGKKAYVLNQKETEFAQEKQRQLQETFKNWIFADPVRREEVVETYNRMFNSIRPREYDGSVLEFPGMNNEIQLRKHQRDAVAHALYGGNTLFAHEVGAGKTFEMIAAAMEGKRLGLHHKAMICVPNHLTEQIGADFIKLYPNANVLVATSKDFTKNNRRKLFGKIATGDYDGIIIGHSQLVNLPISKERQQNLLEKEIDEIVFAIKTLKAQSGQDYQVKQLERTKKSLEAKLEKLIEAPRRDDVVDFEELGIDKLILDEAHEFKNLFIATKMGNISGISTNDDVQKTFDLYLKCQYLDEITNNKGLIFATGTPVSNSISEIYNMQKYLQSDLLRETGLNHFDMWAANFAETVTESQLSPEGNKYQMKTRFAKFNNLPELMALFKECADIKTADMLGLKTPECTMHSIVAQPSGIQKSMIENLAERAKRIRLRQVDRKDDNMPMITNDGRKIGLDQRLMNSDLPDDKNSKLNTCINNVYDIWDKTSDKKLTQVIFCDLGVPQNSNDKKKKGERFSVYDDIKNKLIAKGVPADEIAFIHDAATEEAKDKLFAKVRKGDVRVIIGSTKKMGTGTNIQTKLVALHDLDAPWRPADMEQRRGRMVRQGNENEHVDHFRYVTEGTFDAYLYQMLENKQKFISQIMTSKSPVRSCQDMDEVTLSYAEVKALSAGNPLIKEKMDLDIEVGKLKMLKSAHENNLYKLQNEVTTHLPMKIQYLKNEIKGITSDIEKAKNSPITYDSDGKAIFPSIEVNGKVFTDKEEAGKALIAAFQAAVEKDYSKNHEIGNYRGFKLLVGYNPLEKSYGGMLQGEAKHITTLGGSETGNFTRLDNLISTMDRRLIDAQRKLDGLVVELEEAKTQLDVPFPREKELREKTKRLDELTKMLEADADDNLAVADNISEKTTSITDPYYLGECTPGAISILEKNDIYFETHIIEDKPHVKINAKDKDTVHALLEEKPKLTL